MSLNSLQTILDLAIANLTPIDSEQIRLVRETDRFYAITQNANAPTQAKKEASDKISEINGQIRILSEKRLVIFEELKSKFTSQLNVIITNETKFSREYGLKG
ncbi:MAG: hypothetical protein AABX70_08145 [Nanoarchaeota archaeon]|mgnify:CR=1 FL=1